MGLQLSLPLPCALPPLLAGVLSVAQGHASLAPAPPWLTRGVSPPTPQIVAGWSSNRCSSCSIDVPTC